MADVKPDLMIYKILIATEWQSLEATGQFEGSAADKADGFIHFSRANQLQGTLDRHYTGVEEIVLLEVATQGLIEALKWEESRGGTLFPHLYSTFSKDDVRRTWNVKRTNGEWLLPPL